MIFLRARRAQREQSSSAGKAGRQAGRRDMKAETERRGTVGVTSASSAVVDYFVYPASALLTNS